GLFTAPRHATPLVQGAVTSLLYIALFLAVAWRVHERRAFAGASAVQHHRWRTPIRAVAAVGALVAALAIAGSAGPPQLTGGRLEGAIAPTSGRSAAVQSLCRTGRSLPAPAARASCRRSNGARRGPGDDWSCIVRVLGRQAAPQVVSLEVTLRAN